MEVDSVALLTALSPQDQGEVDTARNGVAVLPQGLSYQARTGAVSVQKGLTVAGQTLRHIASAAPGKSEGLALSG